MIAGTVFSLALVRWLVRRHREHKPTLFDPELFSQPLFKFGIIQSVNQQIALGGLLIALPIYLQLELGYNALQAGLSLAPLSLSMFLTALLAGKRAGRRRPSSLVRVGFLLLSVGVLAMVPIVPHADTSLPLVIPLMLCGVGMGLLVSQINNYTLAPISDERVGEASGSTPRSRRSASRSAWPSAARSCSPRCRSRSPTARMPARSSPPPRRTASRTSSSTTRR